MPRGAERWRDVQAACTGSRCRCVGRTYALATAGWRRSFLYRTGCLRHATRKRCGHSRRLPVGGQRVHCPHAQTRRGRIVGGLAARTCEVQLGEGRVAVERRGVAVERRGELLASRGAEFVFCSTQRGRTVGTVSACGERSAVCCNPPPVHVHMHVCTRWRHGWEGCGCTHC